MASKTDIANIAVGAHQGAFLQDVDSDPGNMADALRTYWTQARDEALGEHPWKFAKWTWRTQNAAAAADNPSDLKFFYRLPPNCARVFLVPPGLDFTEWQGGIACDEGPQIDLVGTRNDIDIGWQRAKFNKYLGLLLAWYICTPVDASEAIRKRCRDESAAALAEARSDDAKVGTIRRPTSDAFMNARLGGWPSPSSFR
jgi:hypothetical protein